MKTTMGWWTVGLAIALGSPAMAESKDALRVDHIMYRDPELQPVGSPQVFDPRLKGLWEQALRRPESELQRLAADTIAMAHERGMPDLGSTAADLLKVVQHAETDATARRAAAHAIVVLQAKEHSQALARATEKYGLQMQLVIEPALAKWGDDSLRAAWRERVSDPETAARLLILAIEGLGALRDVEAKPTLLELVRNGQAPIDHRLAAASAVVAMSDGGLLPEAQRLVAEKSPTAIPDRLVGVRLLAAHHDEAALKLLAELAVDPEPAIAGAALELLWTLDPKSVIPLAAVAIKSLDVNVRRVGARALMVRGDLLAVEAVEALLDDPNPSLRRFVAKGLFELSAKPELRVAVVVAAEKHLSQTSWRGIEQAALLLAYLNHAPAASRLIELLPNPRDEVAVTVAWALRRLKLSESLPRIHEYVQRVHPAHIDVATPPHEIGRLSAQLTQIFEFYGEARWADADPMLRNYIPKSFGLGESRYAACWALGKIHEGKGVNDLIELFQDRLADVSSLMPELDQVRMMCGIGLGRMKAESTLPTLRGFARDGGDMVSLAAWWSVGQLTGEKPPEWQPRVRMISGWFLQPVNP